MLRDFVEFVNSLNSEQAKKQIFEEFTTDEQQEDFLIEWEGVNVHEINLISNYDWIYENDCRDNFEIIEVPTDYELGYYWIVDSGCYNIDECGPLANYFDYDSFGRDIRLEQGGAFIDGYYIARV